MGEGNPLSYPPPILGFGWGRIIRHWEKVYQILTTFRSNHFGNWIPILITLSCKNIWNRSILRSRKFVCFWFWHIEMTVRNWMEIILFQIRFIQIWTESLSTSTSLHTRVIHGASMLILSALAQIYFTCFFAFLMSWRISGHLFQFLLNTENPNILIKSICIKFLNYLLNWQGLQKNQTDHVAIQVLQRNSSFTLGGKDEHYFCRVTSKILTVT